ncbi:MAG: DUF4160 domain-containing protein [Ignavibacteriales bacterium]|nr:MAG: DUF4160 domain-containing protein [Ignavibacteriales bacterium]
MCIFAPMSIINTPNFSIHVWGFDHPPPHCHVRFKDGSSVCVTIPFIEPMYGATISYAVRKAIEDNLDEIVDYWDALHPIRQPKRKNKTKLK